MRLTTVFITVPCALAALVVAVANRAPVVMRLDPFSQTDPAIAFEAPLYALIFGGVFVGMLLGGGAMWLSQGRVRRRAWSEYRRAQDLERELKKHTAHETTPADPAMKGASTVEATPVAEPGPEGAPKPA